MIKLIVAHANNLVIGYENRMPWHIKEELQFFRKQTINHHLLMGKNTFLSIGKVLPNRISHVLTTDTSFTCDDDNVVVVHEALPLIEDFKNSDDVLFISGGASIYKQFYDVADELYISRIDLDIKGDAFFVDIDYSNYLLNEVINFDEFKVYHYIKR